MTLLYIGMIIALAILFAMAINRQVHAYSTLTPMMGWLAGLIYFIVVPLTFIILNQGYSKPGYPLSRPLWGMISTEPSTFLQPFLIVWITLALTNLTVIFFTPKFGSKHNENIQNNTKWIVSIAQLKKVIFVSIFISFAFWIINVFILGDGLSSYFSTHWYYRFNEYTKQFGRLFTLYLKIYSANQLILTAATGLLILAALKREWEKNYGLLAFAIITLFLHMIMSGNRIYIALMMIYLLMGIYTQYGFKSLIKLTVFLSPVVVFFSFWAYIRDNIANLSVAIQHYVTTINSTSSKVMTTLMDLTEGSDSMILMKVITDFGNKFDYLNGSSYLRVVTWILPFDFHAESFSITLAKIYQPGIQSSMNATAIGEMWANFGYFTIILMPLFTYLIMRISNHVQNHLDKMILINSLLFIILIWIARSVFGDNFQILVISLLIIWGLRYEKDLYCVSESN